MNDNGPADPQERLQWAQQRASARKAQSDERREARELAEEESREAATERQGAGMTNAPEGVERTQWKDFEGRAAQRAPEDPNQRALWQQEQDAQQNARAAAKPAQPAPPVEAQSGQNAGMEKLLAELQKQTALLEKISAKIGGVVFQ